MRLLSHQTMCFLKSTTWTALYDIRSIGHMFMHVCVVVCMRAYVCMCERIYAFSCLHYSDVIMGAMASQITSLTIVYSTVYSSADNRKHQNSALMAFVWGIHR